MTQGFIFANKFFWRSPMNLIFSFVIPFVITMCCCVIWTLFNIVEPSFILPALSYMPILYIGIISVPLLIFSFREAYIFRRIQFSKFSIFDFVVGIFTFYILILILSFFTNITLVSIFLINDWDNISLLWQTADWWGILYTLFITILLCLSIGICIGVFAKKISQIQIIGITIVLINNFLGYWMMPIQLLFLEPGGSAINIMSYGWVFGYISKEFTECWIHDPNFNLFNSNIYDLKTSFVCLLSINESTKTYITILTPIDKWLDLLLPALTILIININSLFFYNKTNH